MARCHCVDQLDCDVTQNRWQHQFAMPTTSSAIADQECFSSSMLGRRAAMLMLFRHLTCPGCAGCPGGHCSGQGRRRAYGRWSRWSCRHSKRAEERSECAGQHCGSFARYHGSPDAQPPYRAHSLLVVIGPIRVVVIVRAASCRTVTMAPVPVALLPRANKVIL